jgi:SAM-dependent methyltransferase
MSKILLSPHDDDNVLFAAFICMREKPLVVICFDSYVQPARGEVGCSIEARAAETAAACNILGCEVVRLGLRDNDISPAGQTLLEQALQKLSGNPEWVYAPALQHGNANHDMVNIAAHRVFSGRVVEYTTYTKTELYTTGNSEIKPTTEELRLKKAAMDCHESQLRINLAHFKAVLGKSEWLTYKNARVDEPVLRTKLHMGCGKDKFQGWINLDRTAGADVVCDVVKEALPFEDSSIDYVYSQDFLEHLPPEARVPLMNEIWRVLKPGHAMEHYVPNAGSRNDYGSPSHLSHWNLQLFEHFDVDSYRWEKDRVYEGFIGGFKRNVAELVNWQIEEDGVKRAQSIHVVYTAVKPLNS